MTNWNRYVEGVGKQMPVKELARWAWRGKPSTWFPADKSLVCWTDRQVAICSILDPVGNVMAWQDPVV